MSWKYDDILALPHHVSAVYAPMPSADRAAQFSPFAALTGYGAAIAEAGRLTSERVELDENELEALNEKLDRLLARLGEGPAASFTYFLPDERKAGGAYVTVSGAVKRIDRYERVVVLETGVRLPIDDIAEIELTEGWLR